jgi:hypothetical protein
MQPTLGQRAGMALNQGWQLLQSVAIGLLQVWPLIALILAGWAVYRYRRGKRFLVRA